MEVNRQFVERHTDATAFLQPADTLLNNRPLPIGFFTEPGTAIDECGFVGLVGNDGFDPAIAQAIANALIAVDLVGREFLRSCGWPAVTSTVSGVP